MRYSEFSNSVFFLQIFIFSDEGIDSADHSLDELNFTVSKSMFIRDIIKVSSVTTRFSSGSSGLESKGFTSSLEY